MKLKYITFFTLCAGCFIQRQPHLSEFKHQSLFSPSDTNLVQMLQVYSFVTKEETTEEQVLADPSNPFLEHIVCFLPDGTVFFYPTSYRTNWLYTNQVAFLKNWKLGMQRKGFYYSSDNKNLKIEILDGLSTQGYFFLYYDCKVISKDSILIKKIDYKPCQKHYARPQETLAREGIGRDYDLFKHKPLK